MFVSIQKEDIFQIVKKAINYNIQLVEMGLEYILPLIVSCDFYNLNKIILYNCEIKIVYCK
jgi:hypothetical protein